MDKINIASFGILPPPIATSVNIGEIAVEVTPRIPYEELLDMIQWCINYIVGDQPFISAPLKVLIKQFAILKYYTNIDFDFMTKFNEISEIYENYDILDNFKVYDAVAARVDPIQLEFFEKTLDETLESIISYRCSAKGIVDQLVADAKENTETMQDAVDFVGKGNNAKVLSQLLNLAGEVET